MPKAKTLLWFGPVLVLLVLTGERLLLRGTDPEVLRFAHTFTTASERAIVDAAIAEFERTHPPLKIEQTIQNSETYQTIGWRLQFQGRKQPDLYFHWRGFKVDYAIAKGWALDVAPYLSAGFLEQFVPALVVREQGKLYHLPQSVDISNVIWYNRETFEAAGLSEPSNLSDWLSLCHQLRLKNVLPLAQGNRDLWPMGNFGAELMGQRLGADGLRRLFEPGELIHTSDVQGLQTFASLRERRCLELPGVIAEGGVGSLNDTDAKILFLTGKAAQHAVGSWFVADIEDARRKNELHFTVGVFPIPRGTGEVDAMTTVATGYLVNPASANPKAAVAFLELLLSRQYQSQFAQLGNLSARRDAREFTTDPLTLRMLEILAQTEVVVPPPDTGYRPEQAHIFYELCAKILEGKLDLSSGAEFWNREKEKLAQRGL